MRSALCILAFLAAFAAVNRFVVARVPLPVEAGLRAKVTFAEDHLGEYDAFFIGSSATLYGLRPDVFEEELAARGYPGMRVCNLGVGGMGSFEGAVIFERVLKHASDRLAWVFYEEPLFDPLLWSLNVVNPRYTHWHTFGATADAIQALRYPEGPPDYKREAYETHWLNRGPGALPEAAGDFIANATGASWRRGVAWEHIRLGAIRESALGEGANMASAWLGRDDVWPTRAEMDATRGWANIALDPDPRAKRQNLKFLADAKSWNSQLANLRSAESVRPPVEGHYDLDALRGVLKRIRAKGAQPIMYVAPRSSPSPMMNSLHDAGEIPVLFQFNAPTRYPELDDMALRWDKNHLNADGAAMWSRLFARRFADHLDATGGKATKNQSKAD